MMTKRQEKPVFRSIDEYTDFAKKYKVFGKDAIKLKQQMIKTGVAK